MHYGQSIVRIELGWSMTNLIQARNTLPSSGLDLRTNQIVSSTRTDFWYDQTGLTLETGGASATYLRDPQGDLLSVHNGTLYNYGRDRLSSTTALVTTGQALNTTYRYDPWGESIGGTGSAYNPFQFTGVYRDSATSVYRMTQRYYQPAAGRFTQMDPLPESVMLPNRYEYAGCNPSNFVDPSGLNYACASAQWNVGAATLSMLGSYTALALAATFVASPITLGVGAIVGAGLVLASTGAWMVSAGYGYVDACS